MINPLLDIATVDFANPDDINGFVALLCHEGNELGMFKPTFNPTSESRYLRQTAGEMVSRLYECLSGMTPADSLKIIQSYDLAHRLAYKVAGNPRLINRCLLGAFDAMIHGDKDIDEYSMYREIDQKIRQKDNLYFGKPLTWNCLSTERWFRHIDNETDSDYDKISRVGLLLGTDLFVYVGNDQEQYKHSLFGKYRHYLDCHDSSDQCTLHAVNQLLTASWKYLTPADRIRHKSILTREIITHPHTNRFVKAVLIETY